jgi:TPP-dependent indolepyruvate ferredoxin oxidoreductase alpha subunit
MALTENTSIDQIEIVSDWNIQVRQATIIERDGEFVSRTFHRWVLTPDSDISGQEQKVKDICNAAWTDEVKSAYETFKAEQANRLGVS